jgi:hypothetical protein
MISTRILAVSLLSSAALFAAPADAFVTKLQKKTVDAFDTYIRSTEAKLAERTAGSFLWADQSPSRRARLRKGETVVETVNKAATIEVPDGLVHDWVGAVFIPGVTLPQVLSFVQNYDNHKNIYQPEVVDSKLRNKNGNDYKVFLRLVKHKVITVTLNTEHDIRYFPVNSTQAYSRSYSRRIAQVDDAGAASEKEKEVGIDNGFLWRLNSYWHFQERDGGVYVECEAVSLTRGIPFGLGIIIKPIISDLPAESLAATLEATKRAVGQTR